MLAIAWLMALGLLTLIFGRWEANQYNPNSAPEYRESNGTREVVLKSNRQHHYVSQGLINNHSVTFLLDTGATDVVVPEEVAKQLQLQRGSRQYATTANGVVEVFATRINQLSIGNIQLYNIRASINPAMGGTEILLGMSALKEVEFTQRGDTLTLRHRP